MSASQRVNNRVKHLRKGTPFTIDRLYRLGSRGAIQAAMRRMVDEGVVVRVANGIYAVRSSYPAFLP